MSKLAYFFLFCVFLGTTTLSADAQTTTQPVPTAATRGSLNEGSLDSQFIYLNRISKSQEDFKLVRRRNLDLIRQNVLDTLKAIRVETTNLRLERDKLAQQLQTVNDSLAQTKVTLEETLTEKKTLSFLGMRVSAVTYNLIIIGIIVLLGVLLAFSLFKLSHNNLTTREAKDALNSLQEEFDQHRKKSIEKEQKLMRQLQDEINKRNA
jgi:phosphatidate phosphatase PAH1